MFSTLKTSLQFSFEVLNGCRSTLTGKLVLQIFAVLAEYDRESILEKTRAGQLLVKAKGKHIGHPAGLNAEKFAKAKKALERGLPVAETVSLTGISMSSIKRYRKQSDRRCN